MRKIQLKQKPPYWLSLGCGEREENEFLKDKFAPPPLHKEFIGLDERDMGQEIVWKILNGIPLPDESVKFIWASHIMEHFDNTEIMEVMEECWRVLQHKGLLEIRCPADTSTVSNMPFHKSFIHWNYFDIFFNGSRLDRYGYHSWELVEREKYHTERGDDFKFILKK